VIFFRNVGGEVKVSSAFAEAYFPLIGAKQSVPLVRSLVWSVTGHYDDFGAPMVRSRKAPGQQRLDSPPVIEDCIDFRCDAIGW